jgi:hypothetical protein
MRVELNETEAAGSPERVLEKSHANGLAEALPCIAVKTHDNSLDSTTYLGHCTFGKDFIYLFFGSVEGEVSYLSTGSASPWIQQQHIGAKTDIKSRRFCQYFSSVDLRKAEHRVRESFQGR